MNIQIKNPISVSTLRKGIIVLLIGVIFSVLAFFVDAQRASVNNLIAFLFITGIALGSLFLVALEYISGAVWSVPMRRIPEFLSGIIPYIPFFMLPLLFNLDDLFHWTHSQLLEADELLKAKEPYLNVPFFITRTVISFLLWVLFYWLFSKNSQKQDSTAEERLTRNNIRLAAVFIPVFGLTVTLLAIDWAMSTEPHWYSTIIGVYFFAGIVISALAATTYIVIRLFETQRLPFLVADHFYSLGALLFAFINFWAYIAFSQFLLIWYANLPEETFWFIKRWNGGWQYISILLILVKFVVPYLVLLPQEAKMNVTKLKFISLWLLIAQWIDLYWFIKPTYYSEFSFNWIDFCFPIVIVGFIVVIISRKSHKHNLIPVGDPKLERGLKFHL